MTWKIDPAYNEPKPRKFYAIRCFTCKQNVPSKNAARAKHMGHEVHYVDKEGRIDE